jgi:hypothetical protein
MAVPPGLFGRDKAVTVFRVASLTPKAYADRMLYDDMRAI